MSDPDRHVIGGYGFAPIPEWILYHPELSDKAVRIFGALMRHGTDPTNCYPSDERLGKLIGCEAKTIPKHRKQLYAIGAVVAFPRFEENGRQTTNGYRLAGDIPLGTPAVQHPLPDGRGGRVSTQRGEREPLRTTGAAPQTTSTCGDTVKDRNLHVAERAREACDLIGNHLHAQAVKAGTVAPIPAWQHLVARRQHAHMEHQERAERLAYTYPDLDASQLARRLYGGELRTIAEVSQTTEVDQVDQVDEVDVSDIIKQTRAKLRPMGDNDA